MCCVQCALAYGWYVPWTTHCFCIHRFCVMTISFSSHRISYFFRINVVITTLAVNMGLAWLALAWPGLVWPERNKWAEKKKIVHTNGEREKNSRKCSEKWRKNTALHSVCTGIFACILRIWYGDMSILHDLVDDTDNRSVEPKQTAPKWVKEQKTTSPSSSSLSSSSSSQSSVLLMLLLSLLLVRRTSYWLK